ncbi:putative DNA-binding protein (MmcQ/YjbR family) [Lederbergia galactosidilyticus]|nr:putative DNA-binding protein (MmcQ/YjbR family) [Lederbergia galactosidilytica]
MNKEHWISIVLDGSVPKEEIFHLIDLSYDLTK